MTPLDRKQTASWPGAIAVESCTYTLSHGISPGTAILRILPQDNFPAETGDLVIDDGVNSITIPRCKIDQVLVEQNGSGFVWSIAIQDRRWQWRDFGQITGCYNQLDPHGKLIPWTIRSPYELAVLCLEAMGEKGYVIDMPPGYTRADGEMHGQLNPPHIGLVPKAGVNPPVDWKQEPPAQALQSLCDQFGRRVVYRLSTDSILIAIEGRGNDLPGGSISSESPSPKSPASPGAIAIIGAPTKYQAKFWLEAVGEEWDGSYVPIDLLSYRPGEPGAVQISTVSFSADTPTDIRFLVILLNASFSATIADANRFSFSSTDPAVAAANIAEQINTRGFPGAVPGTVRAVAVGPLLTVTGTREGFTFSSYADVEDLPTDGIGFAVNTLVQAAVNPTGGWETSQPPLFANVKKTDRLTYYEALALAQKSVYRCYRLTAIHPTGKGQLVVPGFGKIDRRQQIQLLDTKVEQVKPVPLDRRLVDPKKVGLQDGGGNAEFVLNFYNGYSRDMPATMTGSIMVERAKNAGFAFFLPNAAFGTGANTPKGQQIYISFAIDPVEQIVTFSSHAFRTLDSRYYPIESPVLETGCHIREADNNGLRCAYIAKLLPGGKGNMVACRKHDDVQLHLIGKYDDKGAAIGATALEADAHERARYYLAALEAQYIYSNALTRGYNGIEAIDCDGAIAQVTWSVGPNGPETTASRNTEHSFYVPPYPARRRNEFLRPVNIEAISPPARLGAALMGSRSQHQGDNY